MGEKLLLVEDDESLRDVLTTFLQSSGYEVDSFRTAEEALASFDGSRYACVLADFMLPGKNGIELLAEVRSSAPGVPFVIMTAYGSIEIAVDAMKGGANDFICKPFEPKLLTSVVRDVIAHKRIIDRSGPSTRGERAFLTEDSRVERMLEQARKVARVDSSVLILGESGTGKELVARFIHENSPRRNEPFVAINCAALPPELLESDLFGHEAGAFTGATQSRIGLFEVASHGTIFLDEIGDMPPALQVKLLRALQEREIKRVGANKSIKVDPRIIAATNHDLELDLESGKMRDDFYYRIAVVTLTVPPLRERHRDIDLLADHYVAHFCARIGRETARIDETARDILRHYTWPGNARELENVIERAVILADGAIVPDHLGIDVAVDFDALAAARTNLVEIAQRAARKAEVEAITRALHQTSGNKSKAARLLGVSYKTLLNKIKEYGLRSEGVDQRLPAE